MKNIILFDNQRREQLLPFTFTRPVCEIRVGALTIREKWAKQLNGRVSYITQDYLSDKYDITISEINYLVNGAVLPNPELCSLISQMESGQAMLADGELVAAVLDREQFNRLMYDDIEELDSFEIDAMSFKRLGHIWDIFLLNGGAILTDFEQLTAGRLSQNISDTNTVTGPSNRIFLEPGARMEGATLNTTQGPIYLGKNAEVMEGALIRGPFALGESGTVKMGAKIYGPTSAGPHCTLGGEVKNVVMFGYSSKGHEGYLGNSVVGEWCNLGAGTNCSNLKNNWKEVKIWDYISHNFEQTDQLKAGVFMGDYTMTGINTMLNTGTVVGLCCNVFGGGYAPRYIPSFSWGGHGNLATYPPGKAFEAVERMLAIKEVVLSPEDRLLLLKIFEETSGFRDGQQPPGTMPSTLPQKEIK
jgi:UDP-N-acetylglucosamine diphosphorylase/glucosamine-1-phosphate N-acetyltransferase